jgi:hypothetical protein
MIENELKNLDLTPCQRYQELRHVILHNLANPVIVFDFHLF